MNRECEPSAHMDLVVEQRSQVATVLDGLHSKALSSSEAAACNARPKVNLLHILQQGWDLRSVWILGLSPCWPLFIVPFTLFFFLTFPFLSLEIGHIFYQQKKNRQKNPCILFTNNVFKESIKQCTMQLLQVSKSNRCFLLFLLFLKFNKELSLNKSEFVKNMISMRQNSVGCREIIVLHIIARI